MRNLKALVVAVALTLTLVGCSSDDPSDPTTTPVDAPTTAPTTAPTSAVVTSDAPRSDVAELAARISAFTGSLRYVKMWVFSSASVGSVLTTVSVDISVDFTDPANPKSQGVMVADGQSLEVINIGTNSWMRYAGGEWQATPGTDLEVTPSDGMGEQYWIAVFGTGTVEVVGTETINGIETQHLRVSDCEGTAEGATVDSVNVWLDDANRIHRAEMMMISQGIPMTTVSEYYDFDVPVEITAPI
ncbi:MAG: hypothetical protein LBH11_06615 [Propionibacteriaceae bacterium]|jgi:hypothetical protein|nr:hypothetical protein [Propionibacteriaceae bacterium]